MVIGALLLPLASSVVPELCLQSVLQFYMVLCCLVHAWAYVGTAKVASKLKPGTTVRAMG